MKTTTNLLFIFTVASIITTTQSLNATQSPSSRTVLQELTDATTCKPVATDESPRELRATCMDTATSEAELYNLVKTNSYDSEQITALLEADVNPNTPTAINSTDYYNTPLHWAAYHNNDTLVKLLLIYGADSTLKDSYDKTPEEYAAFRHHHKILLAFQTHRQRRIEAVEEKALSTDKAKPYDHDKLPATPSLGPIDDHSH